MASPRRIVPCRLPLGNLPGPVAETVSLPPWVYPPPEFYGFDEVNYVPVPAIGLTAIIVQFVIPDQMSGVIKRVGNNIVAGGWTEGTGDMIFRILVDGLAFRNYDNIISSLGSPANPVEIAGIRVRERQLVQVEVQNVALVANGFAGARLSGWYYPQTFDPPGSWYS